MLQLAYLLKFAHVQVDLLLILFLKRFLLRMDTIDNSFSILAHGGFYFESQLLALLL